MNPALQELNALFDKIIDGYKEAQIKLAVEEFSNNILTQRVDLDKRIAYINRMTDGHASEFSQLLLTINQMMQYESNEQITNNPASASNN